VGTPQLGGAGGVPAGGAAEGGDEQGQRGNENPGSGIHGEASGSPI